MVVLFFFFYVDVYDFLSIVKCICLFSLLTIHDKALHDKRYQLWNRKKWLGTRVMFEFNFTSKILRLIITNNNSIDEPNGLKDNFLQFFQGLGLGPVHPVHWI